MTIVSCRVTHATIERRGDNWVLRDAHSRNGTFVNGTRVSEHTLAAGDRISVGSWVITFVEKDDPQSTVDVGSNSARSTGTARARSVEDRSQVLSARERDVLALLADGATDHQIAKALFISVATVRSHLDRIRDKTGCRRRPELTRLAVELGLR